MVVVHSHHPKHHYPRYCNYVILTKGNNRINEKRRFYCTSIIKIVGYVFLVSFVFIMYMMNLRLSRSSSSNMNTKVLIGTVDTNMKKDDTDSYPQQPDDTSTVQQAPLTPPMKRASILQRNQRKQMNRKGHTMNNDYHFNYFRNIVLELVQYSAADILYELQHYDPFGVRNVYDRIVQEEIVNANQSISLSSLQQIFPCPPLPVASTSSDNDHTAPSNHHRITYPDRRNMTKLYEYQKQLKAIRSADSTNKNNSPIGTTTSMTPNYYIYFQHLRKAGGTHFCTLAQQNLPQQFIPKYYCMPDYYWPIPKQFRTSNNNHNKYQPCAGCLHRYSNEEIEQYMDSYKIMGNEWDNFNVQHHFALVGAIYTTSFRRPIHRALSQYRFECVEERGCTAKSIEQYWTRRTDLYNVYTSTFSDIYPVIPAKSMMASHVRTKEEQERINTAILTAYDTILQFHLVLIMELLPYSERMVQEVLQFKRTTILTQKIRPHNTGKQHRTDSWIPEEYLSKQQYSIMSQSLVYDEILYDVARRIFLERLVCNTF